MTITGMPVWQGRDCPFKDSSCPRSPPRGCGEWRMGRIRARSCGDSVLGGWLGVERSEKVEQLKKPEGWAEASPQGF